MTDQTISNEIRAWHRKALWTNTLYCDRCVVPYPCAAIRLADAYDALYEAVNFARNELSGLIGSDPHRNPLLAEVWTKLETVLSGGPK